MKGETRQWIASFICAISLITTGTGFAWVSPLQMLFISPTSPVPMTSSGSSWITASIEIGAVVASLPSSIFADRYGRKTTLLWAGAISLLGWALIITTRSFIFLCVVRFIQGLVVGIVYTVAPIYLAEISEPKIRGKITGQFQTGWLFGHMYAYITGPYLSYELYAYACAIVPVIFIALFYFMPETPHYLLMKKEEIKSREALAWLQHSQDEDEEFQGIKNTVEEDMKIKSNWKDLFATKKDIKALLLVQFISIVHFSNGSTSIPLYITQVIDKEISLPIGKNELTIIFSACLVFSAAFASLITDRVGRRALLIGSTFGCGIFNLIITVISFLDSNTSVNVSQYKWISYVSLIGFSISTNIGIGPLLATVQTEYFPTQTRSLAGGVTQVIAGISSFINIWQFQVLEDNFGTFSNFAFFSIVCIIGVIVMALFVPETSGKTFAEVQQCFDAKTNEK